MQRVRWFAIVAGVILAAGGLLDLIATRSRSSRPSHLSSRWWRSSGSPGDPQRPVFAFGQDDEAPPSWEAHLRTQQALLGGVASPQR
jgi:hypothetical protein